MNKFLNRIDIKREGSEPSFLNGQIDTSAIQRAGTSGDRMTDIAFDKAIKLANELNDLNKANELSNLKLEGQNKVLNYETEWNDKDKFSEENFSKYKEGLENILKENAEAINKTKYTSEADVISWKDSHRTDMTNQLYKITGQKAQYDIKATVDTTMMNIQSLSANYIATGNEDLKKQIIGLWDGLKKIQPHHEMEIKKIQTLVDLDTKRAQNFIEGVMNDPNLKTPQEKLDRLKSAGSIVSDTLLRKADMNKVVSDGYISKEYKDAYYNYSKSVQESILLGKNGVISKLERQAKDEADRKRNEMIEFSNKLAEETANAKNKFIESVDNKDLYSTIKILEGSSQNVETLLGSSQNVDELKDSSQDSQNVEKLLKTERLITGYTDITKEEFRGYKESKKYIPVYTETQIKHIKERLADAKNSSDTDLYGAIIYDTLNDTSSIQNDRIKTYSDRQLSSKLPDGHVNSYLYSTVKKGLDSNGVPYNKKAILDYNRSKVKVNISIDSLGASEKKNLEKMFTYTNSKGEEKKLSPVQQHIILQIIQGRIESGHYSDSSNIRKHRIIDTLNIGTIFNDKSVAEDVSSLVKDFGIKDTNFVNYMPAKITVNNETAFGIIEKNLREKKMLERNIIN